MHNLPYSWIAEKLLSFDQGYESHWLSNEIEDMVTIALTNAESRNMCIADVTVLITTVACQRRDAIDFQIQL